MQLEELKVQIQRKYIDQNTASLNVETAKEKKNAAILGSKNLQNEGIEIEQQIVDIEAKKKDILKALEDSEALEKNITKEIADASEILELTR